MQKLTEKSLLMLHAMQKDKRVKMLKTYIRVEKYKQQLEDVKKNTK